MCSYVYIYSYIYEGIYLWVYIYEYIFIIYLYIHTFNIVTSFSKGLVAGSSQSVYKNGEGWF